jgi:hypothetical protein
MFNHINRMAPPPSRGAGNRRPPAGRPGGADRPSCATGRGRPLAGPGELRSHQRYWRTNHIAPEMRRRSERSHCENGTRRVCHGTKLLRVRRANPPRLDAPTLRREVQCSRPPAHLHFPEALFCIDYEVAESRTLTHVRPGGHVTLEGESTAQCRPAFPVKRQS